MRAHPMILFFALLASLLLVACSSPCQDLDARCEKCPKDQIADCKRVVTWLSDSFCDSVLTLSPDECPDPSAILDLYRTGGNVSP